MNNKADYIKVLSVILGALLAVSVFKNISYPLFWADESMTAMGSERILKYGYPKAHDGKNVLNDMVCNTPGVAVNAKDDAFIGGANWGQYYFGVIGYLLAAQATDIYVKTGIYRSTFAVIGLLGLLLLVFVMSRFFADKFYKYLFISLFLLCELISISMALHLREVRYYSPALFFGSSVICLYTWYKFYPKGYRWDRPFNKVICSITLAGLLWIVFNMFSPLYFIFILAITISEAIIGVYRYGETKNLKEAAMPCLPVLIAIVVSYIFVYPLLGYFKTFEMEKILDNLYNYNSALYWQHFSTELGYFSKLDLLWLVVAMRITALVNIKKAFLLKSRLFMVSNFLSLLFVVFIFSIPDISNLIFTRYLIYMQPVLSLIAIFDFLFLIQLFSASPDKFKNARIYLLIAAFAALFGFTLTKNLSYISGHVYEMMHPHKGPLDYTIPYIQSHYQHTDTLIIAANYEETSYMYYLKSKVIVGSVGNNLPGDTMFQPDIIAYRQMEGLGGQFVKVFNGYLKKAKYQVVFFPAEDIFSNNSPELNLPIPVFDHYFQPVTTDDKSKEVNLIIKM